MSQPTVKIGLLGCGTVGSQVVRLLTQSRDDYEARCAAHLEITGIAVNNTKAKRDPWIDMSLVSDDANAVIDNADIVIELIGGVEPPRTLITRALSHGKTVVTGNKALLAEHGPQLFELTAQYDASLYYEAAVAGAVPVVYGLRESLVGDRILRVQGIVNGTTNYILDQMTNEGWSYDHAVEVAQELGYAEADPSADVDGLDAGAKCALLASLAFHSRVSMDDVTIEGISKLTKEDIADATACGQVIKLIAEAARVKDSDGKENISVRVAPMLLSDDNPLYNVGGAFNAILIDAEAAGRLMFYGQGAGGAPTASAVMSDVVAAAFHVAHGGSAPRESTYAKLPILDADQMTSAFRLRLEVDDKVGVLHTISGIFAEHGISISGLSQQSDNGSLATVTVTTHETTEGKMKELIEDLTQTSKMCRVTSVLRQVEK